jgi:hypothetical protein
MRTLLYATLFTAFTATAMAQTPAAHPRDGEIHSADTLAWWHTTEDLSGDSMEGRDTGTAAYQRAAEYVAERFRAAGLKPAGDDGTYFQTVPMHQVDVNPGRAWVNIVTGEKVDDSLNLRLLKDVTVSVTENLPRDVRAELVFRGYCGKEAMQNIAGKAVVCFGTQRAGLPGGGERVANARAGGAVALLSVDDEAFTIEPPRWPYAYARSVTLGDGTPPADPAKPLVVLRMSAEAFRHVMEGLPQDAAAILKAGGAKQPLASFDLKGYSLRAHFEPDVKEIASPNVLAVLPGSDPSLASTYVVIAAHLDGYGFGTPVDGDTLYNGALDDAAYVALLIQMADDIKAGTLARPKRSILFCAFTGEEKGLLGSNWFVQHPTVAKEAMVADVNLDQLRPLFPLNILTAEAVNDTTLGKTARDVAKPMGIEIREDREPERGLLRRADQYPFLKIGVPAISFIFGYDPGTDAERRYREWYQVRYHRPQDDITQPMDFDAATKFDTFFYTLVLSMANAKTPPSFLPGSPLAPKK